MPKLINLLNPYVICVAVASLILSFASGYALSWHHNSVKEAKVEVKSEVVAAVIEPVITKNDEQITENLSLELARTRVRAASLQKLIEEFKNAKSNNSPDCALPTRLRDEINHHLDTGRSGSTDGTLRQ